MKKYFIGLLALALACSSCGTSQMASGDPGAIFAGAAIGGNVGGAIGGLIGDSNGAGEAATADLPSAQLSEPLREPPLEMPFPHRSKRSTVTG